MGLISLIDQSALAEGIKRYNSDDTKLKKSAFVTELQDSDRERPDELGGLGSKMLQTASASVFDDLAGEEANGAWSEEEQAPWLLAEAGDTIEAENFDYINDSVQYGGFSGSGDQEEGADSDNHSGFLDTEEDWPFPDELPEQVRKKLSASLSEQGTVQSKRQFSSTPSQPATNLSSQYLSQGKALNTTEFSPGSMKAPGRLLSGQPKIISHPVSQEPVVDTSKKASDVSLSDAYSQMHRMPVTKTPVANNQQKVTHSPVKNVVTGSKQIADTLPNIESGQQTGEKPEQVLAESLKTAGDFLNKNSLDKVSDKLVEHSKNKVESYASNELTSVITGWLGQYGRVRGSINASLDGGVKWTGDYIQPIYETEDMSWLVEAGTRLKNKRALFDIGLIYRHVVTDDSMLGLNLFFDQDLTRGHTRVSFGAEAVSPGRRLNANYYMPVSSWQDSDESVTLNNLYDLDKYSIKERVASGFDFSLEETLSSFPSVSGKITYARWFGDHVDVLGQQTEFLASPQTLDLSLGWNPLQALKFSAGQTFKPGKNDTRFLAEMTFDLSRPLAAQLLSSNDGVLASSITKTERHQFVNRNTDLVLEYQAVKIPGSSNVISTSAGGYDKREATTDEQVKVVAKVLNPANGKPVAGVPVVWDYYRAGEGVQAADNSRRGVKHIESSVRTDSNGEAYIILTSEIGGEVRVQAVL